MHNDFKANAAGEVSASLDCFLRQGSLVRHPVSAGSLVTSADDADRFHLPVAGDAADVADDIVVVVVVVLVEKFGSFLIGPRSMFLYIGAMAC